MADIRTVIIDQNLDKMVTLQAKTISNLEMLLKKTGKTSNSEEVKKEINDYFYRQKYKRESNWGDEVKVK